MFWCLAFKFTLDIDKYEVNENHTFAKAEYRIIGRLHTDEHQLNVINDTHVYDALLRQTKVLNESQLRLFFL